MSRTTVHLLLALIAASALTGCATHRAVTAADVTPRTELRVRLTPPRPLTLRSQNGDSLALDGVIELQGMMISGTTDSLRIAVERVELTSKAAQRLGSGTTTTFAIAGATIEAVDRHKGRTIAFVVFLALGAALLIAVINHEEPPPPPPPEPKPK